MGFGSGFRNVQAAVESQMLVLGVATVDTRSTILLLFSGLFAVMPVADVGFNFPSMMGTGLGSVFRIVKPWSLK